MIMMVWMRSHVAWKRI